MHKLLGYMLSEIGFSSRAVFTKTAELFSSESKFQLVANLGCLASQLAATTLFDDKLTDGNI